ncbi:MAG: hypothetical protein JNK82_29210 [Myxococcaceae bacterium]|nr:hypothetical protein [Myxococcaceae bacterium]
MSDVLEELIDDAKLLVDAERQRPGPTAAETEAILARVMEAGAVTAAAGGAVALKVIAGVVVGLAVGGGLVGWRLSGEIAQLRAELEAERRVPALSAAVVEPTPPPPPVPAAVVPEPVRPRPVVAQKPVRVEPEPAAPPAAMEPPELAADSIAREATLIDRARTALLKRDFESAELALTEYAQRFPAGRMIEEQELMMVQLHLGRGRHADAQRAAERFRQAHPKSLFMPTLNRLVDADDGTFDSNR